MKRIEAVDMVRVEIEYGKELDNYEERFYSIENNDKLEDVLFKIFTELKNDFSKYDTEEVEFSIYGLVDTDLDLVGKCYDNTWEEAWDYYLKYKPWF